MKKSFLFSIVPTLFLFCALNLTGAPLNVRDFGAVGDGIADDTKAIQRALNAVNEHRQAEEKLYANYYGSIPSWGIYDGPCKEIFFPAGKYKVTRTLVGTKGIFLSGEEGSLIFTENPEIPIFYFERYFRGAFRNLSFRGGRNHLYYWSANQDTTSFVVENCRFEDSSEYALTSRSYAMLETAKDDSDWDKMVAVGPFIVEWDEERMPTLKPGKWDAGFANSTKFVCHNCTFINCAGGSDIMTDGSFISACTFKSERPQQISPFKSGVSGAIYDTDIQCAIPKDFDYGFTEGFGNLRNVKAITSTEYGAPLYYYDKELRSKLNWSFPETILIDSCRVDSANGKYNAVIRFPKARAVQFTMRNTVENKGREVSMFSLGMIPVTEEELMEDQHAAKNVPLPPVEFSHCYCLENNGKEIVQNLPEIMQRFVNPDVPAAVRNSFPAIGSEFIPKTGKWTVVLDAADFGISYEPTPEDEENLHKLFTAAAQSEVRPLVRLPGRRFDLTAPLQLPQAATIRADGRTFFHCPDRNTGIFKVNGEKIDIDIWGITFNGGKCSVDVSGAGEVRFRDCVCYDNGLVFQVRKTTDNALKLNVFASTFFSLFLLENYGAEVRIMDSWISTSPRMPTGSHIKNFEGGTLVINDICGVPVIFYGYPPYGNWQDGQHAHWVENHGTFRSTFFRYGGEFGGMPILESHGPKARAFIEGQNAHFYVEGSDRAFMSNDSPESFVAISTVSSFWECVPENLIAFCVGVAPKLNIASFPEPIGLRLRDKEGKVTLLKPENAKSATKAFATRSGSLNF